MSSSFFDLILWDWRVNRGLSFDHLRAILFLLEFRWEQLVYHAWLKKWRGFLLVWYATRFLGSIFQWLVCNSNMPGSVKVGRGLRLPHPQNIILAFDAELGEFCTLYHNVTVGRNSFRPDGEAAPKIGDRVLAGAGSVILGGVVVGSDVVIGAGTVVVQSIPNQSLVVGGGLRIMPHPPTDKRVLAGSPEHLRDPLGLWR